MIALVSGTVAAVTESQVVVDCGGVGYLLHVSDQTLHGIPPQGSEVRLHTHLVVRDDSMSLFGFESLEERDLFLALTGVPSVGPKLAMAVVGSAPPSALAASIASGDAARLQSVPGVGKRTAERICLDLRDSLAAAGVGVPEAGPGSDRAVARDALLGLGMAEREVESLLDQADGDTAEELIQGALKLSKSR
jgi:Holliday junction DNA helicase RuvA